MDELRPALLLVAALTSAVVGGVFYGFSTFGITAAFNVPLNEALARAPAEDPSTVALWERYLRTWTAWNHVRSAAAIGAAAAFILALAAPGGR